MTGFFANKTSGNCPTKVDALYYEAAKLAANVVKRFNTKNFTTRKKNKIGGYFFQKVEFVRPIPGNVSFHPLIINVLEKHAAS